MKAGAAGVQLFMRPRPIAGLWLGAAAVLATSCDDGGGGLGDGPFITWVTTLGGPEADRLERLEADPSGRALVAVFHGDDFAVGDRTYPAPEVPGLALVAIDEAGDAVGQLGIDPPPAEIFSSDLTQDALGNRYVGGFVLGGDLALPDFVLKPTGGSGFDGYLFRQAPDGRIVWAERYGGAASVELDVVTQTPGGQIWVLGDYRGAFELGGVGLPPADGFDVFAARLSPTGAALEVVTFTGPSATRVSTASPGPDGGVVLGGVFTEEIAGGGRVAARPGGGSWAARIDGDGQVAFLEAYGDNVTVEAVAATEDRVFIAGDFIGALSLPDAGDRPAAGPADFYVRVAALDGTPEGVTVGGGEGLDDLSAILPGPSTSGGGLWVSGTFEGELPLGPFRLSAGAADAQAAWVALFDDALDPVFATSISAPGAASQLATAPGGDVLVGGTFEGSFELEGRVPTSAGDQDVVVFRLSPR